MQKQFLHIIASQDEENESRPPQSLTIAKPASIFCQGSRFHLLQSGDPRDQGLPPTRNMLVQVL